MHLYLIVSLLLLSDLVLFLFASRDAAIYALGVGACARDALDEEELKYLYHKDGQQFIQVFFISL